MAKSILPAVATDEKPAANGKPLAKSKPGKKGKSANRSAAIRDELAKDPKTTSKAIVETLAKKGIKVTPTLVYYVKSQQHKAKRKQKRVQVAEMSQKTAAHNPVQLVSNVKELAREVGGIANLKKLIDLLAE